MSIGFDATFAWEQERLLAVREAHATTRKTKESTFGQLLAFDDYFVINLISVKSNQPPKSFYIWPHVNFLRQLSQSFENCKVIINVPFIHVLSQCMCLLKMLYLQTRVKIVSLHADTQPQKTQNYRATSYLTGLNKLSFTSSQPFGF